MTHFRYYCRSSSGKVQVGFGETSLELGSPEQTADLLHEIARDATTHHIPWDPFNLHLTVVPAQIELKPMTLETFKKMLKQKFDDYYQS